MDKPNSSGGFGGSGSSWPENSGSDQDFGATGVFGAVTLPDPASAPAASKPEPDFLASWAKEPPPPPPPAPKPIAEPVVHKVVLEGGAAASSPELLDRMGAASAERSSTAERQAAPDPASKGSGGFTELLRTLGTDSPASAPKQPPPAPPVPSTGFTSLLQTMGSADTPTAPVASPPPAVPQYAAPSPGGITELLRATPISGGAASAPPPPPQNQPGSFTQLFGTMGGAAAPPSAPPPFSPPAPNPPSASPGSFTQMLSLEQRSAPVEPVYREPIQPPTGGLDYSQPAPPPRASEANRDPFASSPLPPPPAAASQSSSVGITRLIQMLDEPSKQPEPSRAPTPIPPPRAAEPGVWTQTFASLNISSDPVAPTPPAPPAAPAYPSFAPPLAASPQPAAPAPSGPSEFTRILDASRIRELSMQGGTAPQSQPPQPPQSIAPPSQFAPPQMPSYPMPAAPAPPAMQGFGAMPQPGAFPPPPQPPAFPMQFGAAPPPSMPMPGGMPQPGMFAPPLIPPAPQLPAVKAVQPPTSKLQQLVPLLLVVIIVLLLVLIITVFFLMKH